MVMPGALAFKPALAALIVLVAAETSGALRPQRAAPAEPPVVAAATAPRAARALRLAEAPAAAAVERRSPAPRTEPARSVKRADAAPAPQRMDFENDNVTGDFPRPWIEVDTSTTRATHQSLIEIRRDMMPEMVKSLENI
jgi:hypothetical protein